MNRDLGEADHIAFTHFLALCVSAPKCAQAFAEDDSNGLRIWFQSVNEDRTPNELAHWQFLTAGA